MQTRSGKSIRDKAEVRIGSQAKLRSDIQKKGPNSTVRGERSAIIFEIVGRSLGHANARFALLREAASISPVSQGEAMVDLAHENVISLADAPSHLPDRRGGKRPHISCIYRWTTRGIRGVVLESLQVGGTKCTSVEALQRFFERLSAGPTGGPQPVRTAKQRQRASQKANDELAAAGW